MRKGLVVLLVAVAVAMLAAPAVAGTDVNGYYRTKAWMSNFRTSTSAAFLGKDAPTNAFVEQRMRLKFTTGEENVKAVAFFEIDFSAWGDTAGSSVAAAERNSGGALGGDKIDLETKNVYVWFKLPDTSLDFTVGLQNQSDAYAGLLFGAADMAGVFANGKMDPVSYKLGWAKLYENVSNNTDDLTFYLASVSLVPMKDAKIGLNLYFLQDDTQRDAVATLPYTGTGTGALGGTITFANKKRVYVPGVDFALNAGPATLSGFLVYQTGTIEATAPGSTQPDVKIQGFAVDLRGDMNAGPGKAFLEGLYITGGDKPTEKIKSIVTFSDFDASPGGNSAFGRTDMSVLLVNADDINCAQALVGARAVPAAGSTSPALGGRGLMHLAAGYTQKLTDKLTGKVGAGYLKASKLLTTDTTKKGKELGIEVNANVNYNIMKGLDFGVYGAYAFLGDYFKSNVAGVDEPDDVYSTNLRLNYAF